MSKHLKVYSTFKTNVMSGVKGSSRSLFKMDNLDQQVAPLAQYLMETLSKLSYPLVRSSIFSLVNIYSADSRYSVGYMNEPHPDLILPNSGLVLTFSMVSKSLAKSPKEIYTVGGSDYSIFWGKDYLSTTDYLTICIPKNILSDWELRYSMQPDLIYLHGVIGILTKAFVQSSSFLVRDGYTHSRFTNREIIAAQYNHVNLQRLLTTRSINHWIYSQELWTKASNLIHEYHFYPEFGNYFALELFDWVRNSKLVYAAHEYVYGKSPNGFIAYVERGLRDLKRFIRKEDIYTLEMEAAVHLLFILGGEPQRFDVEDIRVLQQYEQMPQCLSDVHLAARSLVEQTDRLMEIAEVLT